MPYPSCTPRLCLIAALLFSSSAMASSHPEEHLSDDWECISCTDDAQERTHAGTFADPKPFDEATFRGAVHRGPEGFYRAEFNGVRAPHDILPDRRKSTTQWTFLAERAGTFESPLLKGDATYPGAIHYDNGNYYRSLVTREAVDTLDMKSFALVDSIRHFIVTSDPQYPWSDKTNKPGDTETDARRRQVSEALIKMQFSAIQRFRKERGVPMPVIVNGDITAYGHGYELKKMKSLLATLDQPVYIGLGNHDYENNVNNCGNNGCARDMLHWLDSYVQSTIKPQSYELSQERATRYVVWTGSLSYLKKWAGISFLQLNNFPGYTKNFSSGVVPFETKREFRIKNDMRWFDEALYDATNYSDLVIVNMHDIGNDASSPFFNRLTDPYFKRKIAAVFAGHYHDTMGVWKHRKELKGIPVFLSGAVPEKTFLIAEIHEIEKKMRVYGVTNNNTAQRKLLAEIPLNFTASSMGRDSAASQ